MNSSVTRSATIGATSIATASAVRMFNGRSAMDTTQMVTVGAVGAVSAYVAPTIRASAYNGVGRGLVEALVSGVVAGGILYAYTGDSSVALHIPVQTLAHIGGSAIHNSVSAPMGMPSMPSAPASADEVAMMAEAF